MDISDFITDFDLKLPEIELRSPHVIAVHIGWLNWGSVGDASFDALIDQLKAKKLAAFKRPGDFYDFVTYRDRSRTYVDKKGNRHTEFPNSRAYYVRREEQLHDLILLNLLEPTQFGEVFVDKVVALMNTLDVARYDVIGAMGSSVPHTRPIIVTGRSSDIELTEQLKKMGVRETLATQYQGPTSILNTVSLKLQNEGITTITLLANLPTYFSLEGADCNGISSVLNIVSQLEKIEIPLLHFKALGKQQYDGITREVRISEKLSTLVRGLEIDYDREEAEEKQPGTKTDLPPSIQKAINEILDNN